MHLKGFLLTLFFPFFVLVHAHDRPSCAASFAVRWNLFTASRNLMDYKGALHEDFFSSLLALKPHDTWIDLGGGQGRAAEDYLVERKDFAAQVLLVTYKLGRVFGIDSFGGRLQVLKGRLWEEISLQEIPQAKLITDVFGVLSYSRDLSLSLYKAFDRLEKNGELYLHSSNVATRIDVGGKTLSLTKFLMTIPGLRVEGQEGVLKVTKLVDQVYIPRLAPVKIDETHKPPLRRFRLD